MIYKPFVRSFIFLVLKLLNFALSAMSVVYTKSQRPNFHRKNDNAHYHLYHESSWMLSHAIQTLRAVFITLKIVWNTWFSFFANKHWWKSLQYSSSAKTTILSIQAFMSLQIFENLYICIQCLNVHLFGHIEIVWVYLCVWERRKHVYFKHN